MEKKIEDYLHLYLGCEVQYEGIINGKELKAEMVENKHDIFYIPKVEKVVGTKRGFLKEIHKHSNGKRVFKIGRKGLQSHWNKANFKPILRPLSSMTEEEMKECGNLVYDFSNEPHLNTWDWNYFETGLDALQFHWLLAKHFDIFGLIPAGLALDATLTPISSTTIKP